jgi:predicted DNA-binding transcriptional regulator AlpA
MDKFLRFTDLQARGIVANRVTLSRWIRDRGFPAAVKLGPNTAAWRESEVNAWLGARMAARHAA